MMPEQTTIAAIETKGLSKRYPGLIGRRNGNGLAVNDLCITVNSGDIYGFLGPNGSGKTTTIRMIMGLIRPTAGGINIFGHSIASERLETAKLCGAMIDVPAFYSYMSARANLRLFGQLAGGVESARVDEVLDMVGLLDRANSKVRTFSHGMKQRLGFASAMLMRPKLLLLDEPTNGLDPEANWSILSAIRETNRKEGTTVLISSHLLSEVEDLCNRTAILRQGRLLYEGSVRDLVSSTGLVDVRVSDPDAARAAMANAGIVVRDFPRADNTITVETADAADLNELLVSAGVRVLYLAPRKRTLREVFLDYMHSPESNSNQTG